MNSKLKPKFEIQNESGSALHYSVGIDAGQDENGERKRHECMDAKSDEDGPNVQAQALQQRGDVAGLENGLRYQRGNSHGSAVDNQVDLCPHNRTEPREYYYTLFLPEARCVCRQAAVKAAKILPLDALARSKQDPINRGHGGQYLYHPPPAGAKRECNHEDRASAHEGSKGCLACETKCIKMPPKIKSCK